MRLYDENGYVDVKSILSERMPFTIIIGGRGTGKTYTTLKVCKDEGRGVMLLRRTQTQIDLISKKAMNPYKRLSLDENFTFDVQPVARGVYEVFTVDDHNERLQDLAVMAALSTISNLRGFDASTIDTIIFDEFIPESHERPMKHEADALLNCYETVNRNRELYGEKPVQLLMLANSNRLDSEILMKLGLTKKIEGMRRKGQVFSIMKDRGVCIVLLDNSPISEKKAQTALYKLTEETEFSEMALSNEFSYSDMSNVQSLPLSEFRPLVVYGDICVYKHRSERRYYACKHIGGPVKTYEDTETNMKRFRIDYQFLTLAILRDIVIYESFEVKAKLLSILL